MLFLIVILTLTTGLLCYAGYIFLIVDKRAAKQLESNPDVFSKLDDKEYNFDLPEEVDKYDELRGTKEAKENKSVSQPCAAHPQPDAARARRRSVLPMALLRRAMADIPRIEQLERDHPRMARLHTRGLLPFGLWEQLLEAEQLMDREVQEVQAEAEKLQKGWGQGVFGQAYQELRKQREAQSCDSSRASSPHARTAFTSPRPALPRLLHLHHRRRRLQGHGNSSDP